MWIKKEIVAEVDKVARIYYIDFPFATAWNKNKRGTEQRLMTGWMYISKRDPSRFQRSLKSQTACYIAAYYDLVLRQEQPKVVLAPIHQAADVVSIKRGTRKNWI
jgi:hypothetical protein